MSILFIIVFYVSTTTQNWERELRLSCWYLIRLSRYQRHSGWTTKHYQLAEVRNRSFDVLQKSVREFSTTCVVSNRRLRNVPDCQRIGHGTGCGLNVADRFAWRVRQHLIGGSATVGPRRSPSGRAVRVAWLLSCADRRQSPLLRLGSQRRPSVHVRHHCKLCCACWCGPTCSPNWDRIGPHAEDFFRHKT